MNQRFYTNVQLIGNKVLCRGIENGERFEIKEEFYPTLFLKTKKETEYKTLNGEFVEPIKPGTVKECRAFYEKYEDVDGFEIYGNDRFLYQYISEQYPEEEIKYDSSKIKIIFIDIETSSENGFPDVKSCSEQILAITIQNYNTRKIITWGVKPFNNTRSDATYVYCETEHDLLNSFLHFWITDTPDIVSSWNGYLYDVPYIVKRIDRVLGEKEVKKLSPWGLVSERSVVIHGNEHESFEILGVTQLDYLDLYKKFTYKAQESYRLDYIAEVELGQKKLDHSEYETFKEFYTKNWQKFIEYNIIDTELVCKLEDKMKLIDLALTMAYRSKVNYADVFSQVRMWDVIIYNYLKQKNIVVPPKVKVDKDSKYAGAYVKEPVPGMYGWIVSLDLTSLYPSLIMEFNISPETLIDKKHPTINVDKVLNKELDLSDYCEYSICPNGSLYRKDVRGFLPELMEKMFNERILYKKKMLEAKKQYEKTPTKELEKEISKYSNFQLATKVCLNSAYGSVGNPHFRFYKLANAEAITLSGQAAIRWIHNKLNSYFNKILKTKDFDYVIAVDTDSVFLNVEPLVNEIFKGKTKTHENIINFLDKVFKTQVEKYIDDSYQELADYLHAYEQKMNMKRECIADRGIWTAKKRYIMNVWDSEGVRYEEPKLKIMGIEAIKSSTPSECRRMLKESFKIMMSGSQNDMINFIEKCRKEFYKLSPEQIAFPRTASDVQKFKCESMIYRKGTPIHVRGALLFNYYLNKHKLTHKYSKIQNGEKIKYIYLKMPNPIHENVLAFIQDFPKEFGLDKYVDYELQFNKSFLDPLKIILDVINWKTEHNVNLDSFFQ
jgi:DNA polymerase elongation subunit (family B)